MKITLPEKTRDDKSLLSMSASYEEGCITRKKPKKKVPEPLVTANKITQDTDDMKEDDKVGSSIEGTKKTSVCVNPHRSGLTPTPYNNKQDYKGGTQDKTIDSHTPDSDVSRHDDTSLKRNLYEENKNAKDDKYIDEPQIKNDKINFQSHENIRNRLLLKRFSKKIIDLILSNIVQYEKDILTVDYINQKLETKE